MRMRESYTEMVKRARAQGIEPIIATEVTIRPPKAFVETVTSMRWPGLAKAGIRATIQA